MSLGTSAQRKGAAGEMQAASVLVFPEQLPGFEIIRNMNVCTEDCGVHARDKITMYLLGQSL